MEGISRLPGVHRAPETKREDKRVLQSDAPRPRTPSLPDAKPTLSRAPTKDRDVVPRPSIAPERVSKADREWAMRIQPEFPVWEREEEVEKEGKREMVKFKVSFPEDLLNIIAGYAREGVNGDFLPQDRKAESTLEWFLGGQRSRQDALQEELQSLTDSGTITPPTDDLAGLAEKLMKTVVWRGFRAVLDLRVLTQGEGEIALYVISRLLPPPTDHKTPNSALIIDEGTILPDGFDCRAVDRILIRQPFESPSFEADDWDRAPQLRAAHDDESWLRPQITYGLREQKGHEEEWLALSRKEYYPFDWVRCMTRHHAANGSFVLPRLFEVDGFAANLCDQLNREPAKLDLSQGFSSLEIQLGLLLCGDMLREKGRAHLAPREIVLPRGFKAPVSLDLSKFKITEGATPLAAEKVRRNFDYRYSNVSIALADQLLKKVPFRSKGGRHVLDVAHHLVGNCHHGRLNISDTPMSRSDFLVALPELHKLLPIKEIVCREDFLDQGALNSFAKQLYGPEASASIGGNNDDLNELRFS